MQVEETFYKFVCDEVLNGIEINKDSFWRISSKALLKLDKENKALIKDRSRVQGLVDVWNDKHKGKEFSLKKYKNFLRKIGYLEVEGHDFSICTKNVDPEISMIAGPQLVVPITNPRYVLNAANARWGSLYDAVYGSDFLGEEQKLDYYDKTRGEKVISWVRGLLDETIPLIGFSWSDLTKIEVLDCMVVLKAGDSQVQLKHENQFTGYKVGKDGVLQFLFSKNSLSIILVVNAKDKVGLLDKASIADVIIESAITTIMDFEDSVAVVDTEDKISAYRNWLWLMQGRLEVTFLKNGSKITRKLAYDKVFENRIGQQIYRKGRSLLLVRNVGHLMTTPLILNENNEEIGEGLIDCLITAASAIHNFLKGKEIKNSETNSIYIVKPKLHGSKEVAFTHKVFSAVEEILNLPADTLKLGIMDEERRTSLNLKECIRQAKSRVVFINTGFLDRTGDEIHTSMKLGPMVRKGKMKNESWIKFYEKNNVQVGLRCGFRGKAQIGKGMWAMPDKLADMYKEKFNHPRAGGNCAWVPSPTAATIHSIHYLQTNVSSVQENLLTQDKVDCTDFLLQIPIVQEGNLSDSEIEHELLNNAQGILGYVVRWIDQGIGCSKVPDIAGTNLMEDRATCRISCQHISNWLQHGVISETDVIKAFKKMAKIVDQQNSGYKSYIKMSPNFDGLAFKASLDLALSGAAQPNGYTEPILHSYRIKKKLENKIL